MNSNWDRANITCSSVTQEISELLGRFKCKSEGGYLVVTTPLVYSDGDAIDVYLDLTTALGNVQVSDLGDALARVRARGNHLGVERLRNLLSPLKLSPLGQTIAVRAELKELGRAILRVSQAAALVEFSVAESSISKGIFYREVDSFFQKRDVKTRRDVFHTVAVPGRAGTHNVTKRVDFLIDERYFAMAIPKNNQTSRYVEHAYTFWTLLDKANDSKFGRISIVDEKAAGAEDIAILRDVSSVISLAALEKYGSDTADFARITGIVSTSGFF